MGKALGPSGWRVGLRSQLVAGTGRGGGWLPEKEGGGGIKWRLWNWSGSGLGAIGGGLWSEGLRRKV